MAAFTHKAFLDDSGDPADSREKAISVAGYAGTLRCWDSLERQWGLALAGHGLEYFHMKEIPDPASPMHRFCGKDNAPLCAALLADLCEAIFKSWVLREFCAIGCVVPMADLQRFNKERGRALEAIPLALFVCIALMQVEFPGSTIEALLDKIVKPERAIWIAQAYRATSPKVGDKDFVSIVPAKGHQGVRTVRGLQAADFAAYEVRRKFERLEKFLAEMEHIEITSAHHLAYEYDDWLEENGRSFPDKRKSLTALGQASRARCPILTYKTLCEEDDLRGGRWS
jgi:hypothetical protein